MVDIAAITSDNNLGTQGTGRADSNFRQAPGPNMSDTGDATISFDDFLDMINPLQHIPLVSSIYRAATNTSINPVARIAGDTLYGGIFGLASAGIGALGAVADEVVSGMCGKSISETVIAGLFGDDKTDAAQNTQLAQSDTQPSVQTASALQTPARQSPMLQTPDETAAQLAAAASLQAPMDMAQNTAPPPGADDQTTIAAPSAMQSKGLPLDRSKAPYGGVMDTTVAQTAQQSQALAAAMAGQNNILAAQRQLRNSRFAVSNPKAAEVSTTSVTAGNDLPGMKPDPKTEAALQNMLKELQAQKAIGQYKSTALMTPAPAASVDLVH